MKTQVISETAAVPEVCIVSGIAPGDVETVLELASSSGLFSPNAMLSVEDMAWDSAYGGGGEDHTFLLARTGEPGGGRMVGFLCYGPIARWSGNYELYAIAVAPEHQRRGIGSALVAEMNRRVTEVLGRRIFLETGAREAFEGARRFYEAAGFECEHRFRRQFIPVEGDAVYRLDVDDGEPNRQYQ